VRLRLFDDFLLAALDEPHAGVDGGDGEKLGRALHRHQEGPEGGALFDRLDLANFLHIL